VVECTDQPGIIRTQEGAVLRQLGEPDSRVWWSDLQPMWPGARVDGRATISALRVLRAGSWGGQ